MKTAAFTIFLTSLVLNAMYNASLTSFLAVDKSTLPYNDFLGLFLYSSHKVVIVEGTSYIDQLKSGSPIEVKIHAGRLIIVPTAKEGLERALEGDAAFLGSGPSVTKRIGRNCSHSKIPKAFFRSFDGWAVRKDLPYTGFIQFQ